jgi:hypothetical protein
MPMIFPNHFRPQEWKGSRGAEHPRREDAFQQLIGDGLRELVGVRAHISPTRGRDGSIDAFVDAGESSSERLLGLPPPLIVECKDHDDGALQLTRNIEQGLSRVEEKLARQASLGWPGAFRPWIRARAYAYAVSAVLPSQQARDELEERIRTFFKSLPLEQRVPIEAIRVLDWSDIRDWLDRMPRVADRWLGTGIGTIVPHTQFLDQLVGFRRYLAPAALPFVTPNVDASSHPARLFEQIDRRAGDGGVLLVGVGGVGKTRTAVEVGTVAEAAGWRVLHVRAGEPMVETEELDDVVMSGSGPTLVILDYVDQMWRIDPGHLRHRLLPEARGRGIRLGLLATARPGAVPADHAEWMRLLSEVHLTRTSSESQAVVQTIRSILAPTAVEQLGDGPVRELCGDRPIIAMFIAHELERRATVGMLGHGSLEGLRAGDLVGWLRKRLSENELTVPASTGILPTEPDDAIVACAAVLGCVPDTRVSLLSVAERALVGRAHFGALVLDNLIGLGWLERSATELSAAHDVVADEVLEQVLRARPSDSVRSHVLTNLLDVASARLRSFGRLATSLDRLLLSGSATEPFGTAIRQTCDGWLRAHAVTLGSAFALGDADEASYALGATVASSILGPTMFELWDEIAGPWLDAHGSRVEARHLLYVGLRHAPSGMAGLITAAGSWVVANDALAHASFVLGPLLGRDDLTGPPAISAIDRALAWLAVHGLTTEAGFVLPALLGRDDLIGPPATAAIDRALAWLAVHGLTTEAGFVLDPLLGRDDLTGPPATAAIDRALAWLNDFAGQRDAEFVFRTLMTRDELSGDARGRAASLALDRLEAIFETVESSFLLRWVLQTRGLPPDVETRAVTLALRWLRAHELDDNIDFAANRLLRRPTLPDADWEWVGRTTVAWLRRTHQARGRDHALTSCLLRPDLLPEEDREYLIHDAEAFLDTFAVDDSFASRLRNLVSRAALVGAPQRAALIDRHLVEALHAIARDHEPPASDELYRCGLQQVADLLADDRPGAAGYYLVPLLPLAERMNPNEYAQVIELALTVLRHPLQGEQSRNGFIHASERLAAAGAWNDPSTARAALESLRSTTTTPRLSERLRLAAMTPDAVDLGLVEQGIKDAEQLLDKNQPGAAAYFVSPLLPLVARSQNQHWTERSHGIASRLLAHPGLTARQRDGFCRACQRLLDSEAWPSREQGHTVLTELGALPPPEMEAADSQKPVT